MPQAYVDFQIENNVRRSVREITGRDMDLRSLKLDWDKLREQQGERATQDVKASLLLEKIADVGVDSRHQRKRSIGSCSESLKRSAKPSRLCACGSRRTEPLAASRHAFGRRRL